MKLRWPALAVLGALGLPALAHVGSPGVFFQGHAGPYHVAVQITLPPAIPGIAHVSVVALDNAGTVQAVAAQPTAVVGEGAKYAPQASPLAAVNGARGSFAGPVWIMESGALEIRLTVKGAAGEAMLAVPFAATATQTLPMTRGLGWLLAGLLLLLAASAIAIVAAAAGQSTLAPGLLPSRRDRRRGRRAALAAAALLLATLTAGNHWWSLDTRLLAATALYRPPPLVARLVDRKDASPRLQLRIGYSNWQASRPTMMTALLPDHGHLMHLFLLRQAANGDGADALFHLHPSGGAHGIFTDALPAMPGGHYRVFADIVRASGFAETLATTLDLPTLPGTPPHGDDAEVRMGSQPTLISPLPDGGRMLWERPAGPLPANQLFWFRFRVEDRPGHLAPDLEPYMGMAAHTEIVASDFSVFVHLHPDGSVSMPALALANPGDTVMSMAVPSPELSFPYGFPESGRYRVYVQIKRHGQVQTGVFDATVD